MFSIESTTNQSGAKIIQVTSPIPGDGKSTTVSNLAASIAQSGRRVLFVDCDLRKTVQHWLFGLSNDIGLTSVINGEVDPQEAVQVVQPGYLSVVTSGPVPANPAELLTSARYAAILEHVGEQFDFVLIDTPPLLAVTDPSIVPGHVDLCLLVMKIRNGVRTNSVRAREIIDSTGVKLGGGDRQLIETRRPENLPLLGPLRLSAVRKYQEGRRSPLGGQKIVRDCQAVNPFTNTKTNRLTGSRRRSSSEPVLDCPLV